MAFTTSRLRAQFEQIQQLRQTGQAAVADMLAGQLLAATATAADDLYCQGSLLLDRGRFAEALKRFDEARLRGPAPPELLVDRAIALARLGRMDEAMESCNAALGLQRDFAPALLVQADILRETGRGEEALQHFHRILRKQREFIPALRNRADLLMAMQRWDDALADFDRLLRLQPDDAGLHNARGQVLGELERHDEALRSLDKAVALAPRHGGAWHNRGVVLWYLERFDEARAAYERALSLQPNPVTHSNLANTLLETLRLDDAMAAHDQVVALAPDFPSGHWNRAQLRMLRGEWAEGLKEFEWRKRRPESRADYLDVPQPEWLGQQSLDGKTLLICAEKGLGDTLQFVRYAALAQQRGARVILAVQAPLVRLLTDGLIPAADQVIGKDDAPPPFDFHVAALSLPLAFGTVVETAPAPVPYLKAEPERAARWAGRIGSHGFRIGVCWQGAQPGKDMGRSFPLGMLEAISCLPGIRLIALQKGAGLAQLEHLPPGMTVETLGEDFDNGADAFLDSAAVMAHLDLVISSDTSVAHLAGALARPTWMAVKAVPEWRWLLERGDSVWYPTMRLFRQQAAGDWRNVFAAMEAELKTLTHERAGLPRGA